MCLTSRIILHLVEKFAPVLYNMQIIAPFFYLKFSSSQLFKPKNKARDHITAFTVLVSIIDHYHCIESLFMVKMYRSTNQAKQNFITGILAILSRYEESIANKIELSKRFLQKKYIKKKCRRYAPIRKMP